MTEDTNVARHKTLALCQKMLRINTGVILAAFALIIILTTVSTAEWVRATGKVLYYIIVSAGPRIGDDLVLPHPLGESAGKGPREIARMETIEARGKFHAAIGS